ncbi:EamA family transporter [Pseudomonas wenzhouensis]|nr:EamA family transporter [Pseudomonas wenzhouensis]MDM9653252.1 EamA family transporter [Pseudomonas wenzhouensis]
MMNDSFVPWHILFAVMSALAFAVSVVLVRVGVRTATPAIALWLTLSVNVVFLWPWTLLRDGWSSGLGEVWLYFALAGVFAPLLGRLLQFQALSRLGANISTPIVLTHPLVSVVIAVLFLNERLTMVGVVGAILVVTGSTAVGSGRPEPGAAKRRAGEAGTRVYLALPLLASLAYGVSIALRKIGIIAGVDPVAASAVTMTSAWLCSTLYFMMIGAFHRIRCTRRELYYFIMSGVASGLGPVLQYASLALADLVVVAPLASTTPLFVLVLSYFFIRQSEVFTVRVVLGTIMTVIGIVLVTAFGLGGAA